IAGVVADRERQDRRGADDRGRADRDRALAGVEGRLDAGRQAGAGGGVVPDEAPDAHLAGPATVVQAVAAQGAVAAGVEPGRVVPGHRVAVLVVGGGRVPAPAGAAFDLVGPEVIALGVVDRRLAEVEAGAGARRPVEARHAAERPLHM